MKTYQIIVLGTMLLSLIACNSKPKISEPITETEAIEFAKALETGMSIEGGQYLSRQLDFDLFIDRISDQLASQEGLMTIRLALKMELPDQLGELGEDLASQGEFTFCKVKQRDGVFLAIFRVYGVGGLNYHEMRLHKQDGNIVISDLFHYITGEYLSTSMARVYQFMLEGEGLESDLDEEKLAAMETLFAANELSDNGNPQTALAKLNTVEKKLRDQKIYWFSKVMICQNLSDEEYTEAIEEYMSRYPDDFSINLHMMDYYTVKKDYPKLRVVTNNLLAEVGDDDQLYSIIATSYESESLYQKGYTYTSDKLKLFPESEDLLLNQLSFANSLGEFAVGVGCLQKLVTLYDYQPDELFLKIQHEALFASAEYEEWASTLTTEEAE